MHDLAQLTKAVTIRSPADIRSTAERLAEVSGELGFRVGATTDISSRDDLFDDQGVSLHLDVFGWDDEQRRWWDRPQLALKSPVALACRYESEPFWCNKHGAYTVAPNPEVEQISFERFFGSAPHLNAVLMVPTRLTFGRIGAAAFSPLDESVSDLSDAFETSGPLLAVLTSRFLATYALHGKGLPTPVSSEVKLGRREVQCLYWASQGKTDFETAIILGVSHAAIRYHVTRSVEKLDCVNRAQAIFKATQLGFLTST